MKIAYAGKIQIESFATDSVSAYDHDEGAAVLPADGPVLAGPHPHHLLDAVADLVHSEDPRDSYRLEEAHPEQRHPAGRVIIHQLEYIHAALEAQQTEEIVGGLFPNDGTLR